MSFSPSQAAALVGVSKQSIHRAIKAGKLSATRNPAGQFEIEPVELYRVYQKPSPSVTSEPESDAADTTVELEVMRERVTQMERLLRDKDEVIGDLRKRLDIATEEITRLSAVITSQLPAPQPKGKSGWWQRLLGGGES